MRASVWDDEDKVAELTRLWDLGWSASRIAYEIDVSRNAVIGKARRLGLDGRPSPILGKPPSSDPEAQRRRERNRAAKRRERARDRGIEAPILPRKLNVRSVRSPGDWSIPDKLPTFDACQWPQVAPDDPPSCDADAIAGRPYCQEHCERAYRRSEHKPRAPRPWRIPTMTVAHDDALTALERAG